jgi:thiamine-monophosphate kinase
MDERDLIRQIGKLIGEEYIRDDCAAIPFGDTYLVLSTDMVHQQTDFPEGMTDWQMGWMSAAVTLSDIAAMGATPLAVLLAAGLDRGERVLEIVRGASECCIRNGCRLIGGDVDAHCELTLVSSGLGMVSREHLVRRTGARPGDLVCITGVPGRAEAALEGFWEYAPFLLEPQPQVSEGRILGDAGVTSMMDVSDGLVISLYDLLEVNECGYSLTCSRIPLPAGIPHSAAKEFALYGGGDFGLLFTCPPEIFPVPGVDATAIGVVIPEKKVLIDGVEAEHRGYQHHWG